MNGRSGWRRYVAAVVLGLVAAGAEAPPATADPPGGECQERTVVVGNAARLEGRPGNLWRLAFPVTAFGCAAGSVSYGTFNTGQAPATPYVDYTPADGTLTWATGAPAEQVIEVEVIGDAGVEPNELFLLGLFNPVGLTVLIGSGTGTIVNDDMLISAEHTASEPDCSMGVWTCEVWIVATPKAYTAVTVHWSTGNGTATAGNDFVPVPAGTVVIPAGATKAKATVGLLPGAAGYFYITIIGASAGTVAGPALTVSIPSV